HPCRCARSLFRLPFPSANALLDVSLHGRLAGASWSPHRCFGPKTADDTVNFAPVTRRADQILP
ncbi:hypothetical protein, partial [uncultured Sphingobium sp.]|uniref:hypothetical protein n=1 Tax=uncultured Sphingobium sp. TaxID=316087 RepID=UPI00261E0068